MYAIYFSREEISTERLAQQGDHARRPLVQHVHARSATPPKHLVGQQMLHSKCVDVSGADAITVVSGCRGADARRDDMPVVHVNEFAPESGSSSDIWPCATREYLIYWRGKLSGIGRSHNRVLPDLL